MNAYNISIIVFCISIVSILTSGVLIIKHPLYIKAKVIVFSFSVIMFFASMCFYAYLEEKKQNDINPGEIYIKKTTSDNPFIKRTPTDTMRIIDVKDDYALYVSGKDTLSAKKHSFTTLQKE